MIIFFLKILILFLRLFTSNSATALPGLILERYFPKTLNKLFNQFDKVVMVTGTNGKTTTSRILGHLLQKNNVKFISNRSGSNLIRGIASELIHRAGPIGGINAKIAVFEVEEATLPKLVKIVKPDLIIVTNIFRDQLDAYGEIDKTFEYLKDAILNSNNPKLILNKNDDRVRTLGDFTTNSVKFVAFDPKYMQYIKTENRNSEIEYDTLSEGDVKDNSVYEITNIRIDENLKTYFDVLSSVYIVLSNYQLAVPGFHNTFNAVAALVAFSIVLDSDIEKIKQRANITIDDFVPVFGRGEILTYNNTAFQLLLVKNPAGMNLNLSLLKNIHNRPAIMFILNDKTADGKDVSWIWDCDFSLLKDLKFANIFVTGTRRWDMALRIKYEGLEVKEVFENAETAIEKLASYNLNKVYVLPTYTAMLDFRKKMGKYTKVVEMWK